MNDVVTEARTWIGTPWKHQGRCRTGVDCAGLVIEVAKAARGASVDLRNYPRQAHDETMLETCAQHMERVAKHQAQPGDVLVMRFLHQRHIGIAGDYLHGGLSLIHAYSPAGKVVEVRLDDKWMRRVMGAYRFREAV